MSVNFVTALAVKSFDVPDKKRCPDNAEFDLVTVNDYSVARLILGPGWRWSESIRPLEQTELCQHHHLGFCISGVMEVESSDGLRSTIHANDTYAIPPGHDEWVVGLRAVRGRGIPGCGILRAAQRPGRARQDLTVGPDRPAASVVGLFVVWQGTDAQST